MQTPKSQPDAIRKLLTGNLDVSPHFKFKQSETHQKESVTQWYENKQNIVQNQSFKNYQQPVEVLNSKLAHEDSFLKNVSGQSLHKKESNYLNYSTIKQDFNKYDNAAEKQTTLMSSFQLHNKIQNLNTDTAYHDADIPFKVLGKSDFRQSMKQQPRTSKLADFTFKAPAFINFKFNYSEILSKLN